MRIRTDIATSAVTSDGEDTFLTSFTILAAAASNVAAGRMGAHEVGYAQIQEYGADISLESAEWVPLGIFPSDLIALLSLNELVLMRPGTPGVNAEMDLFASFPIIKPPSETYDLDSTDGVVLPWRSYPAVPIVRGLFAEISDVFPVLAVGDGCVWVCAAGAVTVLDFCTDFATNYQADGARLHVGLLPSAIPEDPYGALDPDLAIPSSPYRSISTFSTREHSYAAVGGGTSVTLLRKPFSVARAQHVPIETHDVGFEVNDVTIFPNGAVLVVGTEVAAETPGVGDLRWAWRSPIQGAFGDVAWSPVQQGLLDFVQPMPRIARDGRWVWVSAGAGNIFRFEHVEADLLASTATAWSAELQYWAGPASLFPDGAPPPAEPQHSSVDPCALISGLAFDRGFPVAMLQLSSEQNGGSLMNVFDRQLRGVIYRRRFRNLQTGVVSLPFTTPGSRPVEPGYTEDPAVGYGPSDPEMA